MKCVDGFEMIVYLGWYISKTEREKKKKRKIILKFFFIFLFLLFLFLTLFVLHVHSCTSNLFPVSCFKISVI